MEGLFQPMHLFFILLIVLIIFGPGKLPDLGRGLGKGIREFKDALRSGQKADVRVTVSPAGVTLAVNSTQQFGASASGAPNTAVRWSVNGITGGDRTVGTISESGLYTAPGAVPSPNAVTVTATSQADTSESASASVTITPYA